MCCYQRNHAEAVRRSRIQLEAESVNTQVTRNRLLATAMSDFLDARKSLTTAAQLESLAAQYHLDVDKLQELCSRFNSPSVDESTVVRKTNEDGEESVTMMVRSQVVLEVHGQPNTSKGVLGRPCATAVLNSDSMHRKHFPQGRTVIMGYQVYTLYCTSPCNAN